MLGRTWSDIKVIRLVERSFFATDGAPIGTDNRERSFQLLRWSRRAERFGLEQLYRRQRLAGIVEERFGALVVRAAVGKRHRFGKPPDESLAAVLGNGVKQRGQISEK